MNFSPFPELITQRLHLRQLRLTDEQAIFALRSDDRILAHIDRPKAKSVKEARQFIKKINEGIFKNTWIYWGIILKGKDRVIGTICFWNISEENRTAEIGYELHPDFQGQGFMQEAIEAVISYGFEGLELHAIEACLNAHNTPSIRVLERNGFRFVRRMEGKDLYENEKMADILLYALAPE